MRERPAADTFVGVLAMGFKDAEVFRRMADLR
jgi:hypothetical protein